MQIRVLIPIVGCLAACASLFAATLGQAATPAPQLELSRGDHICTIGNTLADRMQHYPWLETYIHALHPNLELTFRNLGFSGDEVARRPRSENFGDADQWLTKCGADVVLCFFGYNEALRGEENLAEFKQNLAEMIKGMRARQYNGKSAPQLVVFSPLAHEDLERSYLPDGTENNRKLEVYTAAIKDVCADRNVPFVDLFTPTRELYRQQAEPLTLNGIHLLDQGYKALARVIIEGLFPGATVPGDAEIERLYEAVAEKNYYWFSRYRVVDGYNVYGGRSKLAWHGQSNADVMRREMEIFDVMTANRDQRVWAVAAGGDLEVRDDNIPPELTVKTNKQGPLPGGEFPYLGGEEAISKMTIHDGMQVNLFASEEMFPRLANPVQMAVDTDSRLWVSVWPSYPHWNPTEPRRDAIVILPDEDHDGVADECIVFADELNSVTGFEFWGGGVLVAAPPEIWFLQDTDDDDKADVKIRMLQGVSSADTHHSANAVVIGPDGWMYWSRGIFNVANFETPTQTYRSGQTGVHRFNPRTFEMEFHFPIGPNPHGDVIDQWGYQFANDGTGGTGSYVNIGKGRGNRKWFEKRVRPVAATGILSSSHFPEQFQGNFLICNTIGFLGVLQHKVSYHGADIRATEIDPILVSSDPNFRPTDLEVGGDGALYVSDWHNTLIGHMQHNMRDPNRDHTHGRVYRVTYQGRPLLEPPKMKGKPIQEVCQQFFAKQNGTRYRARLELTGRPAEEIVPEVGAFVENLQRQLATASGGERAAVEQALLECLWVFEEQRIPDLELLQTVFTAAEPRVRAAAIRTLGHWSETVDQWEPTLLAAARDENPLVRAEAVKAAAEFEGLAAAEVIFEVANRELDTELEAVLAYAKGQLQVDAIVQEVIQSKQPISAAARTYILSQASIDDLFKFEQSAEVERAVLDRPEASVEQLDKAISGYAGRRGIPQLRLLIRLINRRSDEPDRNLAGLMTLLSRRPPSELGRVQNQIEKLSLSGSTPETRRLAFAAWVAAAGPDDAFLAASQSRDSLRDFLAAVPHVEERLRSELYVKVEPLLFELPSQLRGDATASANRRPGMRVDFFDPHGPDAKRETLEGSKPAASGVVESITLDVPQRTKAERYALRFSGMIQIPTSGSYQFFTNSDDGSRLYIGDQLVVDNDGAHGMQERQGKIELSAGLHPLVVTYFNSSGGQGLSVSWRGPQLKKQVIPGDRLWVGRGENLHEAAIRALAAIPDHGSEAFVALSRLVAAGSHRPAAIDALAQLSADDWPQAEIGPLIDNLIGYLSSMPARRRTSDSATTAAKLATALASRLPAEQAAKIEERLQNLDVRVIAIGTVPQRMIFDKERIVVQAGTTVEFRFSNIDAMPHNFAIAEPGALQEVGELAEATGQEPDAMQRNYIPKTDRILLASRLLQPGENQSLVFEAPTESGVYPYVCTYPGHWRRMHGALYVVADVSEYEANPETYAATHGLTIHDELLKYATRSREWTFDELIGEVRELPPGRSHEVGKELFKVASCVGCHQLDNEGVIFGPELAKLDEKKRNPEYILRSVLEPSRDIEDKYRSYTFLVNGKPITGMIVEETADDFKIVIDPLAKDKPTVLNKDDIEDQVKSDLSLMPKGMLDKLSREEILDLIAFVYAAGDKSHELFQDHSGHHHK